MAWGCRKCMGICFACIGYYILVRVVGIIHLQWTTNGKYCIGVGIGRKTNDNRSMAKDVDDVVMGPSTLRDNKSMIKKMVSEFYNPLQETD